MSTVIRSTLDKIPLEIDADWHHVVVDVVGSDGKNYGGCYTRADLLDAIRTELGAIVIDKTDLPEVARRGDLIYVGGYTFGAESSADDAREVMSRYASLVAYLEANPPVDPKVEALAELIEPHRDGTSTYLARILINSGRIDIKEPS